MWVVVGREDEAAVGAKVRKRELRLKVRLLIRTQSEHDTFHRRSLSRIRRVESGEPSRSN